MVTATSRQGAGGGTLRGGFLRDVVPLRLFLAESDHLRGLLWITRQ